MAQPIPRPTPAPRLTLCLALLAVSIVPLSGVAQPGPSWTHHQGDAQRSGYAQVVDGPLDLLTTVDLIGQDLAMRTYRDTLVETPHGVLALGWAQDGTCRLIRLDHDDLAPVDTRPIPACHVGRIGTYSPSRDLLTTCSVAGPDEALISAIDPATLEPAWSRAPGELMGADRGVLGTSGCLGMVQAPDGQRIAALIYHSGGGTTGVAGFPEAMVVLVDVADGQVEWREPLTAAPVTDDCVLNDLDALCDQGHRGSLIPAGLVATTTGIVVTYYTPCERCTTTNFPPWQGAAAWFTWDGSSVGTIEASDLASPGEAFLRWGANWPAASGPVSALPIGGHLVMVNPRQDQPVQVARFAGVDVATGFYGIPGPAWWQDTLIVPLSASVTRFDASDLSRPTWSWTPGLEWPLDGRLDIYGTVINWPIDVLVLGADEANDALSEQRVYRLDQTTGEALRWIELPGGVHEDDDSSGAFTVLRDGRVLVLSEPGLLHVLGTADPARAPIPSLGSTTPTRGETFSVTVEPPADGAPSAYQVFWGDGSATMATAGKPLTHAYASEGQRTIRVTAMYPDNATATSQATVDVGGQDLNPLQEAFAPGNQDLTFGILGIAVALTGGAVGIARARRKRGRLEAELERVQTTYDDAKHRPAACEDGLQTAKARARGLLLDGKLDEGQAAVLRDRIDELHRQLRVRTLDERFQFLPHGMVLALQDMLADGQITAWEREHVHQVLEEDESLTDEQKRAVAEQVDAWFQRDRDAPGGT